MVIGVGVADSPTGPFRDAIGRPLVGNGEIDPNVILVNLNSGRCLNVVGGSTTAGAALEQRTCSTATGMQWSRA